MNVTVSWYYTRIDLVVRFSVNMPYQFRDFFMCIFFILLVWFLISYERTCLKVLEAL